MSNEIPFCFYLEYVIQYQNKNDEEDTLTLAKLFSNWYVGAVVGFALGTLKGDLTTASIGLVIGATVSWIFKKCLMRKK